MAKKNNRTPDEIDLTTFEWVTAGSNSEKGKPGCGGCHPGGGGLEFDRDGFRYDLRMKKTPELVDTLDGDYFQSAWDRSGVVEIDCFICHMPGYYYKERIRQLGLKNYQWATVAGTGIGKVTGAVSRGQSPRVEYNRRLFNNDGKIVIPIVSSPLSENCNLCHAAADLLKRGFSWNDRQNHDIHNLHGLGCIDCHPGNSEHQIAKGNENLSTVRDDLDGTMLNCRQCHEKGFMGAPKMEHASIRPNHIEKFACEVCHIPALHRASAKGLCVSTGIVRTYPRTPARNLGDPIMWKPDFERDQSGRLWPVNAFMASLYTNLDQDGRYHPIFARELKKAYQTIADNFDPPLPSQPLVRSEQDILKMLFALRQTLPGNRRFERIQPAYHHEGWVYMISRMNTLEKKKDLSWAGRTEGFNTSHNIAPTRDALGSGGCGDCHDRSAHLFQNWIAGEYNLSNAPVTHKKSDLLFGKSVLIRYLNEIHTRNHLKVYICPILFFIMFVAAVRRAGKTAKKNHVHGGPAFLPVKTHIRQINRVIGGLCFISLVATGYMFFFNQMFMVKLFFKTFQSAVVFHCIAGFFFILTFFLERILKNIRTIFVHKKKFILRNSSRWLEHESDRGFPVTNEDRGASGQVLKLILVMGISGALNLIGNYLDVEVKYILSIIHSCFALFFTAFYSAWLYLWVESDLRRVKKNDSDRNQ